MSWKIQKIVLKNFKFFHDSFPLEVNSKNLLIYGENGSGKSSIYWALYTLFQSRLKPTEADVKKYFDDTKDENLLNKYQHAGEDSKIEVTFEDLANPALPPKPYTISFGSIDTRNNPDVFLDFTIASSDFLNYKMLSKLTDKENSVVNDVTDMFVKEIYPFAEFQNDYTDLNGNATGIHNAKQWHEYIHGSISQVEHQLGKRRRHFDANGPKYVLFRRLIREFRDQLQLYLDEISIRATAKLKNEFGIKDVEVKLETDAVYAFDIPTSPRYRDHTLHPLHIRLNAKYINAQLAGGASDIIHLRTFFNEAKLTCIGLAIRLAVVDYKFSGGGNYASLLCLDDLLVSLDMSYRVPVTKALLTYTGSYQLCVFTHDRSLYNMMRSVINKDFANTKWRYLEFYHPAPETEGVLEPKVNMIELKDWQEKFKSYLAQGDYPAAGNFLRKIAEDLIKGILPLNMTYNAKKDGKVESLLLRALYEKTKSTSNDSFSSLYDISTAIMPDISDHLDRLMNPLSHDNKDIPIYRRELDDAFAEVKKYVPIRDGKKVIVKRNEAGTRQFRMEMISAGVIMSADFVTTEQWDYILFPAPTGKKYKDCEIQIKASSGGFYIVDSKMRVKKLYTDMCNRVFHGAAGAPAFDQSIREITTGTFLTAL